MFAFAFLLLRFKFPPGVKMSFCHCLVIKVVPSAPAALDPDTDYSDPFDVRPDPRGRPNLDPKPAPADCCSYMEPFEAQRIISGMQSDLCLTFDEQDFKPRGGTLKYE